MFVVPVKPLNLSTDLELFDDYRSGHLGHMVSEILVQVVLIDS